jgi:starvation-inducible DNA-binding protein
MSSTKTLPSPATTNSDKSNRSSESRSPEVSKKSFPTRIDLPEETRSKVNAILAQQLADTIDLYSHTKQAHWNVKGPHFIGLHELFDELAEGVEGFIDEVAERIIALGGRVHGTTRQTAEATRLKEYPDVSNGQDHVNALADSYAALGKSTRKAIESTDKLEDADTADLLTGLSRFLDKSLWFIEAHVQAEK